ncbi:TetR/AcrR family transcriptional regulator [Tomitella fengzijianii]|uniref:TetR/AcrR family transcriptional regulator n=1 Tax=Tomitella fengzijianii TaxID=2597660 RepID=A0A516WZL5_9ACTN|nr:helix-turn-helix domain-containing protein [Tomitella fengzijianii]QDQ96294.1 TetR/AcrR family transcriptional regulator [Tomitella fengzijianii]
MTGRPRDASIDDRVLQSTRELLAEVGWDELSVRTVAARAGVGRASINRRWSSKAELVLHAVLGAEPDLGPFEGTDMAGWVAWVVRGSHELFHRPDVRAAVPGLLTALRENEQLRTALWAGFSGPAAELYAQRTGPAQSHDAPSVTLRSHSGRTDADLDARALIAMAAGAALFTSTIATEDDSPELLERIAELLTAAVLPERQGPSTRAAAPNTDTTSPSRS